MQKVISQNDLRKYLDGTYNLRINGSVSRAVNAKHLEGFLENYQGLGLNYPGTGFIIGDKGCGVIRFRADNMNEIIIPRNSANGGTLNFNPPFTGNGFATCGKGQKVVPEWYLTKPANILGAEIYELNEIGEEILRAIYKDGKLTILQ